MARVQIKVISYQINYQEQDCVEREDSVDEFIIVLRPLVVLKLDLSIGTYADTTWSLGVPKENH
jgi:hypothetical protein